MGEKYYGGLDEAHLQDLARALSKKLFPGAFLALFGDLGAGKTTFTQGLAHGLGILDIQSPTFTIVREHREGTLPLFHFDAYRLSGADELYAIGFEDYLAQDGVIVMEWCENVPEALPVSRLDIRLTGSGSEPRVVVFCARGPAYEALLEVLP